MGRARAPESLAISLPIAKRLNKHSIEHVYGSRAQLVPEVSRSSCMISFERKQLLDRQGIRFKDVRLSRLYGSYDSNGQASSDILRVMSLLILQRRLRNSSRQAIAVQGRRFKRSSIERYTACDESPHSATATPKFIPPSYCRAGQTIQTVKHRAIYCVADDSNGQASNDILRVTSLLILQRRLRNSSRQAIAVQGRRFKRLSIERYTACDESPHSATANPKFIPPSYCRAGQTIQTVKHRTIYYVYWSRKDEIDYPCCAVEALAECNEELFPNIFLLLKIYATLPVTTCTPERSFSTLRRLKTYLRNSCGQDRLASWTLGEESERILYGVMIWTSDSATAGRHEQRASRQRAEIRKQTLAVAQFDFLNIRILMQKSIILYVKNITVI
ncbi:unnamed protein product [Trichogramma brassicae]|uniref:HAT C-terminal dimerisation domain-containing protein n=1 Tax=Trichogramma brassicae TaxID=86971 RepID=A0A6H5IVU2_9HYME|nr:unnamed protein product [Trichogramma brassicae]